jgi:hypothetical protein
VKKKGSKIRPAFATFLQFGGEVILAFCPLFHDELRFSVAGCSKCQFVLRYVVINVQCLKKAGCSAGKRAWQSIWMYSICYTLFGTATTHFQDWYVLVASHNLTYPITHLFE